MKTKVVDKKIIYLSFILLVIAGKFIRYYFMKDVLVSQGVGHNMINIINNGSAKFGLLSSSGDILLNTSDNASKFFSIINIFNIRTYGGFEIYISILWNLLLIFLISKTKRKFTVVQTIFIMLSIVVLNIFDFCLAKEPLQMLFFIMIFGILISHKISDNKKFIYTLLVLLACTLFYRSYYILILFFFIYCRVLFYLFTSKNKKVSIYRIILLALLTAFTFYIILNVTKLILPSEFNELLRVRLRMSSAVSDIRALFRSTNLSVFSIDYLFIIIRMLFPLELLKLGIKYFPYVIYQLMLTGLLINNIKYIKKYNYSRKCAILLFLAFVLGSATFEPDFGSWVRHETVLFPIVLIMMGLVEEKGKTYGNKRKKIS